MTPAEAIEAGVDNAFDRLMHTLPATSEVLVETEDQTFDSPGGGQRLLPIVSIYVTWLTDGVRYSCKGEGQSKVTAAERVLLQITRL